MNTGRIAGIFQYGNANKKLNFGALLSTKAILTLLNIIRFPFRVGYLVDNNTIILTVGLSTFLVPIVLPNIPSYDMVLDYN